MEFLECSKRVWAASSINDKIRNSAIMGGATQSPAVVHEKELELVIDTIERFTIAHGHVPELLYLSQDLFWRVDKRLDSITDDRTLAVLCRSLPGIAAVAVKLNWEALTPGHAVRGGQKV